MFLFFNLSVILIKLILKLYIYISYVFCFSSCFLFFVRDWSTVLYCGVIRKFLFNGFNSVFLSCAGVCCSVTELT